MSGNGYVREGVLILPAGMEERPQLPLYVLGVRLHRALGYALRVERGFGAEG